MHPAQYAAARSDLPRKTYTLQETGQVTGLGQSTIYLLIKEGKLRTCKVGKRRLVYADSLDELLQPSAA